MSKKYVISILSSSVILMASSVMAGNVPEYDAVCNDALNYFARSNQVQYGQVIVNNIGPQGPLNARSCFSREFMESRGLDVWEEFANTAGQLFEDPALPGYFSALTDTFNEGTYHWQIILQMKPESDINLNIYDSVLKHNSFDVWTGAEQTGRYRAPWGQLFFIPSANPTVSVAASPGEFATPGFDEPFTMDARTLPGLDIVPLSDALYTSKAFWTENLVVALPETGTQNSSGEQVYNLKQGDMIAVDITIPFNNTADIRYGADSITLKYIGIVGTWYYGPVNGTVPAPTAK